MYTYLYGGVSPRQAPSVPWKCLTSCVCRHCWAGILSRDSGGYPLMLSSSVSVLRKLSLSVKGTCPYCIYIYMYTSRKK